MNNLIEIAKAQIGEFEIKWFSDGRVWFPPAWFGDRSSNELPARVHFMDKYQRHSGAIKVRRFREWEDVVCWAKAALAADKTQISPT